MGVMNILRALALVLLMTVGPANAGKPDIIQLSKDTYLVTVENHAGIFASQSTTKKKAIAAANEFAEGKGMAVVPIAMEFRSAGGPGQWPAAEYQFGLVPKDQAQRVSLKRRADMEVDVNVNSSVPAPSSAPSTANVDMYSELLRLDDLRKKGIISEQEFEAQKTKVLARP